MASSLAPNLDADFHTDQRELGEYSHIPHLPPIQMTRKLQ